MPVGWLGLTGELERGEDRHGGSRAGLLGWLWPSALSDGNRYRPHGPMALLLAAGMTGDGSVLSQRRVRNHRRALMFLTAALLMPTFMGDAGKLDVGRLNLLRGGGDAGAQGGGQHGAGAFFGGQQGAGGVAFKGHDGGQTAGQEPSIQDPSAPGSEGGDAGPVTSDGGPPGGDGLTVFTPTTLGDSTGPFGFGGGPGGGGGGSGVGGGGGSTDPTDPIKPTDPSDPTNSNGDDPKGPLDLPDRPIDKPRVLGEDPHTILFQPPKDAGKISDLGERSSLTGAIPEPATWAMMVMGFGAIGYLVRRRRIAAAAS